MFFFHRILNFKIKSWRTTLEELLLELLFRNVLGQIIHDLKFWDEGLSFL